MPVELSGEQLRDVLALLQEHDPRGAQDVDSALQWMGWDREGAFLLRRSDLQLFLWYQLPRKWLVERDDHLAAAERLAGFLDRIGGRGSKYAELCRAPETREMIDAWSRDDPKAGRRLERLLLDSGVEPPDTSSIAWSDVMGLVEAEIRDRVRFALEDAIENGHLELGSRGFGRAQAELVDATLRAPGPDGSTALDAVLDERRASWLRGRSPERAAHVAPVAPLLSAPPAAPDDAAVRDAVDAVRWMLDEATAGGIALTQTGALSRAFVRAAVERRPAWWDTELFGPPHREEEVGTLETLHDRLRELRLLRPRGRKLLATARGKALRDDDALLLATCVGAPLQGDTFEAAIAELAYVSVLGAGEADYQALSASIGPILYAEGWRSDGQAPDAHHITRIVVDLLHLLGALGVLDERPVRDREPWRLTAAGRWALSEGLRARAAGPRRAL